MMRYYVAMIYRLYINCTALAKYHEGFRSVTLGASVVQEEIYITVANLGDFDVNNLFLEQQLH